MWCSHYNHGRKRDPEGKDAYIKGDDSDSNIRVDDFDHIYVHWKDRLIAFVDNNISRAEINKIIGNTLNQFENNKSKYIAEGTGFLIYISKIVDPLMSRPSLYKDKVHLVHVLLILLLKHIYFQNYTLMGTI